MRAIVRRGFQSCFRSNPNPRITLRGLPRFQNRRDITGSHESGYDQKCVSLLLLVLVTIQHGLIGNTEWGEDFEDFIKDRVVACVNTGDYPLL